MRRAPAARGAYASTRTEGAPAGRPRVRTIEE
jgi:hypothetical protein